MQEVFRASTLNIHGLKMFVFFLRESKSKEMFSHVVFFCFYNILPPMKNLTLLLFLTQTRLASLRCCASSVRGQPRGESVESQRDWPGLPDTSR